MTRVEEEEEVLVCTLNNEERCEILGKFDASMGKNGDKILFKFTAG